VFSKGRSIIVLTRAGSMNFHRRIHARREPDA